MYYADIKKVDVAKLEQFESIGKISKAQLDDCYTTKTSQYFTIKEKKTGDGN